MKSTRLLIASILLLTAFFLATYMGLFNRFFKGISHSNQTASISSPPHEEDWASYLSTVENDKVGSIMVDLGLESVAPITNKLNRLRVDVTMRYPSENGLPLQQEFENLNEIDEKTSDLLKKRNGAVYAGHLYYQGIMSLYYYVGENNSFESLLSETMSAFPGYKYEFKIDREEKWESYVGFLYPLPIQMQSIHNQKVVAQLKSEGDKLEMKRPVNHLIYFKNEANLEQFLAKIEGEGFKVLSKEEVDEGEYKIILSLEREDPVDSQSVDHYVLYLWQKAQDAGGDYDGWGSTIVKE